MTLSERASFLYRKSKEKLHIAVSSFWFILTLSVINVFAYSFDIPYLAYYAIAISIILITYSESDFKSSVSLVLLYSTCYQKNKVTDFTTPKFYILLVLFILACLYAVMSFIYKQRRSMRKYFCMFKKDYVLWGLCGLLFFSILSLIHSPNLYEGWLGISDMLIATGLYLLVRMSVDFSKKENKDYIILSVILGGVVLSYMLIYQYAINRGAGFEGEYIVSHKYIQTGWGNSNHCMAFINISMLLSFYYFLKEKRWYFKLLMVILQVLFIFMNILSTCRGGYLGLIFTLPLVLAVYIYYQLKVESTWRKDLLYLPVALGLCALMLLCLSYTGILKSAISSVKHFGISDNGRFKVWNASLRAFALHPVFGSGAYSCHYYLKEYLNCNLWNYHNYFLQILSTTGIFGALAFLFFLVASVKRFVGPSLHSHYGIIILVYFLSHGFVDTLFFNTFIWIILLTMLGMTEDHDFKKLPSYMDDFLYVI